MKKIVLGVLFTFFAFSRITLAQEEKLYVVMTEASWCPYCKANGERVHRLLDSYLDDKQIVVFHHDMSTKETIAKSVPVFAKLKITETMARYNDTAMIYLINAKTKKTLNGFKIKLEDAAIKLSIQKALSMVQ